jgi:hypothetical protein
MSHKHHQHLRSDNNHQNVVNLANEIGDGVTFWTFKKMIIHIVNGISSRKNRHSSFSLAMQFWEI